MAAQFRRDKKLQANVREESGKVYIEGYAAVFYRAGDASTEYRLYDDIVERVMPEAFDRAVREDDAFSFFNHDSNIVLGRTKAGTLKLSIDEKGLKYSIEAPDTPVVRDLVLSPIRRREVDGSSFMFDVLKRSWVEEVADGKTLYVLELRDVRLYECGPVAMPAYAGTTAGVRGLEVIDLRKERDEWLSSRAANNGSGEKESVEIFYATVGKSMRTA